MTLTKLKLIQKLFSIKSFTETQAVQALETTIEIIKKALENGEDVLISGFGKFSVRYKHHRRGINPQTNEDLVINERRVVSFTCSGNLRKKINENNMEKKVILRQNPRYPVQILINELNGIATNNCFLLDINSTGAQILSNFPVKVDDPISLSFNSPIDQNNLINIQGKVRWMVKEKWKGEPVCRFGIIFPHEIRELELLGQDIFFEFGL